MGNPTLRAGSRGEAEPSAPGWANALLQVVDALLQHRDLPKHSLGALSQQGKVSVDGTGVSMIVREASPDQVWQCFERLGQLTRVLFASAFGLALPGERYR